MQVQRPCMGCRLRRVKCNRTNVDGPCEACIRKRIQCLEQVKRTAKLTRNTTGKRVEQARALFGSLSTNEQPPVAGPSVTPQPHINHLHEGASLNRLSGTILPISVAEVALLVQDFFDRCVLPNHAIITISLFGERCETAGWNLNNMSAGDHCLALTTAATAALVSDSIPMQLSLLAPSQKATLRNATAQHLCACAVKIAERAGFLTSPTKDAIDVLAYIGATYCELDDSLPSVYTIISAALSQCNWVYANKGRSYDNIAMWTATARMGILCIKQRRYCFNSLKILADVLGDNEKEILSGGFSNLELVPKEAGIQTVAARTIRSCYVFATEIFSETDPAALESKVRRMLVQQAVVGQYAELVSEQNRFFQHAFGVILVDTFLVHEAYDILVRAGINPADIHQRVLASSKTVLQWLKRMENVLDQVSIKLTVVPSVGLFRHMLAAACQMAVNANADPASREADRQWTAHFFAEMANSWPEFQVLAEQWPIELLQPQPETSHWNQSLFQVAEYAPQPTWYNEQPPFYGNIIAI